MQMVDLVGVTNRIHEDWFQRWIRDPGRYNPGTRMPQYLAHPEFLDGDRDRQFAAIWTYLSDGKKAVLPDGLSRQNLELIVGGEAIVYRGKIRNVGFRGLCVGHPEDANVAYDAEGCAPRLLWKGRFLNVAAHWRSQSMGRIGPLGHDVITLPKGDVWWNTERPASQPPIRPRFRGYRLGEKRRPTLLYDLPGKRVAETGVMRELKDGRREFVRTLSLATGNRPSASSYRHAVASGKKIERRDGGFLIDGRWTVRVDGAEAAVDEDARPPTVFIEFGGSDEQIEVRYQW